MAWSLVLFNKLYYRVNGGTEYEWSENNNLLLPPMIGDAQNQMNTYGNQRHDWLYSAYSNSYPVQFAQIGAYNGGRGLDFNYYWRNMSNGQRIEVYKESGNNNIALVFEKNSGVGGFRIGTKYYSTYTYYTDCTLPITSINSAGNTHVGVINVTSTNIGIITDGTKYNVFSADLYGRQYSYYDENGYVLRNAKLTDAVSVIISMLLYGNIPTPPSPDPYTNGPISDVDNDTTGDFDDASDAITAEAITTLSPVNAGFIKLYKIDNANLSTFASYLFTTAVLDNIKRLWNSPREAILCLNYLPFTPSGTAVSSSDIMFASSDSGADGYLITQQYEELDFGSVTLNEFYGSCLDRSPYTTVQLVLPFAGAVDIDPDEFMGKAIGIKCRVDVYTGAGLYLIDDGTSVLLQIPCTLANPLPWSASDYSSLISAVANTAIAGLGAVIALGTGGAGTPAAVAIAGGFAANTAANVMTAKLHYQHGGAGGMGTGMFGIQKPYLIIKRPRQCLPDDNANFQGYPSMVTLSLGDVSGFTKVFQIHLDGIPATDAEKKELESILKGGVWF